MNRCLVCHACFSSGGSKCPECGTVRESADGILVFAPKLAESGGGFKSHYFSDLARLEDSSFWFRARNELLLWMLDHYAPGFSSMLEVGCGTGYVLSGVARVHPRASLFGSEIFSEGLKFAASRIPGATFMQMDARDIPFRDEFDVVGAFDVLEHLQEDEQVLAQIHSALKDDGIMMITVPQHAWLWSHTDTYACHVRRYRADDLHQKVEAAGFQILRSTSFISALLPAMLASRAMQRRAPAEKYDVMAEYNLPPWLNALFLNLLRMEQVLIRLGLNFPAGGSRLVVAKKPRAVSP